MPECVLRTIIEKKIHHIYHIRLYKQQRNFKTVSGTWKPLTCGKQSKKVSRAESKSEQHISKLNHLCGKQPRLIKPYTRKSHGSIAYAISIICVWTESLERSTNEARSCLDTSYKLSETQYQCQVPGRDRIVKRLRHTNLESGIRHDSSMINSGTSVRLLRQWADLDYETSTDLTMAKSQNNCSGLN